MKRTIMMTALVAVACLIGSCTKEGVYKPSEKISKIYQSTSQRGEFLDGNGVWQESFNESTPKALYQEWKWDGKKLMSITEYDDNEPFTTEFEYNGNRLEKITNKAENGYALVSYDGSVISKIDAYTDGILTGTITFTYDGKKVSKIVYALADGPVLDDKAPQQTRLFNVVNQLFTPINNENITAMMQKGGRIGNGTMTFTWDGKNISQAVYTDGGYTSTYSYTYDNKKNPFKGFLLEYLEEPVSAASKNNVIKTEASYKGDGESFSTTTETTYTYDGNWPVTCACTDNYVQPTYHNSYTTTTYIEYL